MQLPPSPDRHKMCAACPKRLLADIVAGLLGEEPARKAREDGCPHWVSPAEGFYGLPRPDTTEPVLLEGCGAKVALYHQRLLAREQGAAHEAARELRDRVEGLLRSPPRVILLTDQPEDVPLLPEEAS